ncbi:MAG: cytochrome c oxidase subunit 3, partial [Burkholderiaceae bacterium]|nr:cytochrome c oxidase subunit 3 [Burkholderiaceae bacterium]
MTASKTNEAPYYFVPQPSQFPVLASVGLLAVAMGAGNWINGTDWAKWVMFAGLLWFLFVLYQWFGQAISESEGGLYGKRIDVSFRWSMAWFIFSEVMFFAAFFGALFYARVITLPMLSDIDHKLLWPDFGGFWPSIVAGSTASPANTIEAFSIIGPWPIPTINTALLLTSGVTLTIAHHKLIAGERTKVLNWMIATLVLGFTFVGLQAYEYMHAYNDLNLKLSSG